MDLSGEKGTRGIRGKFWDSDLGVDDVTAVDDDGFRDTTLFVFYRFLLLLLFSYSPFLLSRQKAWMAWSLWYMCNSVVCMYMYIRGRMYDYRRVSGGWMH